jgi:N-dimethylarginine dimethylaminohydrolase
MINEGLAVAYVPLLPKTFLDFLKEREVEVISMNKQNQQNFSSDLIRLEEDKVIVSSDCEDFALDLEENGIDVIPIEIQELKKGNGGPGSFVLTLLRK